mgnify:CR=1 FL=1
MKNAWKRINFSNKKFQACVAAEVAQPPPLLLQTLPPSPPSKTPQTPPPCLTPPPLPPTPPTPQSPDPLKYVLRTYHNEIVQALQRKIKEEREEKFRFKARAEYFESMAEARKHAENLPKKTIDAVVRGRLKECGFSEGRMDVTLKGQKRSRKWTIEGMKASFIFHFSAMFAFFLLLPLVQSLFCSFLGIFVLEIGLSVHIFISVIDSSVGRVCSYGS